MNKRGFTLIELLVTILISSFAIGLAGYVYVTAFKNDMNTRFKLKSLDDASQLMSIVIEDIGRMGNHGALVQGQSSTSNSRIYWDMANSDTSQFSFTNSDSSDQLSFKALKYNDSGRVIGVDSVTYQLISGSLVRKNSYIPNTGSIVKDSVILADSVKAFNIRLGIVDTTASSTYLYEMSSSSAWALNMQTNNPNTAEVNNLPLKAGATYEVSFTESPDTSFSNRFDMISDTFSVSMTNSSGTIAPGTMPKLIYSTGSTINRTFTFSPQSDISNGKFVFRAKVHGTPSSAVLDTIKNVKVKEKSSGNYQWNSALSSSAAGIAQKRSTQALEIRLMVSIKGKQTQIVRIVPVPANL